MYTVTDETGFIHAVGLTLYEAELLAGVLKSCGHTPSVTESRAGALVSPMMLAA
jgi:hypothetical protein